MESAPREYRQVDPGPRPSEFQLWGAPAGAEHTMIRSTGRQILIFIEIITLFESLRLQGLALSPLNRTAAHKCGTLQAWTNSTSCTLIDDHISEYEDSAITVSGDIEFSTAKTVKQIGHYILSKYMHGRSERFRNIGNFIVDLEWRAKEHRPQKYRSARYGRRLYLLTRRRKRASPMDEGQQFRSDDRRLPTEGK